MSRAHYPPTLYTGASGQVSSHVRRAAQEPELRYDTGGSASYLATRRTTAGQFGLYRWDMAAAPSGPDPHYHRTISESFYVLAGTVRLHDGTCWVDAEAGDFLHVPAGGVHGFRNESGAPASMLLLFAPGADREAYFEVLSDAAQRLAMTDQQSSDFYRDHDTIWT